MGIWDSECGNQRKNMSDPLLMKRWVTVIWDGSSMFSGANSVLIRKNRFIRVEWTKILEKDKNIIIIKVVKKIIYWLMKWHGITLDKIKWRKKIYANPKKFGIRILSLSLLFW